MKVIKQLCLILIILFIGESINKIFQIPIPGNVIGMIILLIGLTTGILKLSMVDLISKFLLDNLAFFFIPAGVGLINSLDVIGSQWFPIFAITLLSTIIVLITTGLTVQFLKRRGF